MLCIYCLPGHVLKAGRGSCSCFPHFCYCDGYDDGTKGMCL